jgi:hypothetical protein
LKPITFACEETLGMLPEQIARQILDISRWSSFLGYGVLPGITTAEFETRTPEIVGSRIRIMNTDGSRHVEEIVVGARPANQATNAGVLAATVSLDDQVQQDLGV